MSDITDIYSQAPALGEAKLYLRDNLPIATQHEYPDTAMAARFVSKQEKLSSAAVASEMAGELYGLTPLAEGIEDHMHNYTRFVILSKEEKIIVDANKTTIVMHTGHRPGALYEALGAFANNGINLSKLESRPVVDERGWNYIFYVDFESSLNDDRAKKALKLIEDMGDDITLLGSYQSGRLPDGIRQT